ncbi:MAG: PorT family protein [Prevotella sp.]|nr:PorT family protein [Prevotella sp.]
MKKLFSLIAAVLAAGTMQAQLAVGEFSVIPKVGLNLASLTNQDDSKINVGITAGAEAEYQVLDFLGVSAGLMYSQQGVSYDVEGTEKVNLNYLNVPITANFYVYPNLALHAGLQPGFLLTATAKSEHGNTKAEENIKDNVEGFDLSIPLGVSYEYMNVVFDARYNLGVTKVGKGDHFDSRNSVFMITVGYRFNLAL